MGDPGQILWRVNNNGYFEIQLSGPGGWPVGWFPNATGTISSGSLYTIITQFNATTKNFTYWVNNLQSQVVNYNTTVASGSNLALGVGQTDGGQYTEYWKGHISMVGLQRSLWSSASIAQFIANPWGPITQYTQAVNRVITGTQNNAIFAPAGGSPVTYTFGG
jgi:hypothetical protein